MPPSHQPVAIVLDFMGPDGGLSGGLGKQGSMKLARSGVGLGHEAVDGELQVDDGLEDAALETLACQLGEEAFNGVKPGRRGRGVEAITRSGLACV